MNPSSLGAAVTTATAKPADAAAHNIWSMEAPSGKDSESNVKTQDVAAQNLPKNEVRKRGGRRGNTYSVQSGGPTGIPNMKKTPTDLPTVRESVAASATVSGDKPSLQSTVVTPGANVSPSSSNSSSAIVNTPAAGSNTAQAGNTTPAPVTVTVPTAVSASPKVASSQAVVNAPPKVATAETGDSKEAAKENAAAQPSVSREPSPMEVDSDKQIAAGFKRDPEDFTRGERIVKLREVIDQLKALEPVKKLLEKEGNANHPFVLKVKEMESLLAARPKNQPAKTVEKNVVEPPKIIDEKVADLDKKLSGLLDETIKFFLTISEALNPKEKNAKPDFEALRAAFKELEGKFPDMKKEGFGLQRTALHKLKTLDQFIKHSVTEPYTEAHIAAIVKNAHLNADKISLALKETTQTNISRVEKRDALAIHWNHCCKTALEIDWQLALIKEALDTLPEIKSLSWQLTSLLEKCTEFFLIPPRNFVQGQVEGLTAAFRGNMPKSDLPSVREPVATGPSVPMTVKSQFLKLKEAVTASKLSVTKKKEALENRSLEASKAEKMTQLDLMQAIHKTHPTSQKLVDEIGTSYKKIHDHYGNLRSDLIKEWNKLCGTVLFLEWQVDCVEDCLDVLADVRNLSDLHAALIKESREVRKVTNDKPSVEQQYDKYQVTYDKLSDEYLTLKAKVEPKLEKLKGQLAEGLDPNYVEKYMQKKELFEILDPATKVVVLAEVKKYFETVQKQRELLNISLKTFWDDLTEKSKEMVTELRMKVHFINRGTYPYKSFAAWHKAGANEKPYPLSPAEQGYEKPKKEEKKDTPPK